MVKSGTFLCAVGIIERGCMRKFALYRQMISRLDDAVAGGHFFEASWYAYAVLEDRLISLLSSTGGGRNLRMMGPKIAELKSRAASDPALAANFEYTRLNAWKDARNDLMHAMAEGSIPMSDIDLCAQALAKEGAALVRIYGAAARRQKRFGGRAR
ncbi:hypothetical protein [Pseudonocardia sp. TMWB2A]|uniref:hypothetical protein n=1 Tax=Pseudonocardia sp. TMWB2A TaxID=687430 RepID=UPI00307D9DF5